MRLSEDLAETEVTAAALTRRTPISYATPSNLLNIISSAKAKSMEVRPEASGWTDLIRSQTECDKTSNALLICSSNVPGSGEGFATAAIKVSKSISCNGWVSLKGIAPEALTIVCMSKIVRIDEVGGVSDGMRDI
jgi:hypothetical protein